LLFVLLVLLVFTSLQVSVRRSDDIFTLSLREVTECAGHGLPNSKARQWGAAWPEQLWNETTRQYEEIS
jgi:hypothetical protein